jgi:hypothetical protein
MIEAGTKIYGFRMYYGYYYPWPDGEYCFSVYWGEIGVGAIPFLISSEGKKSRVNGQIDLRLEYMKPEIPMDTIRLEF